MGPLQCLTKSPVSIISPTACHRQSVSPPCFPAWPLPPLLILVFLTSLGSCHLLVLLRVSVVITLRNPPLFTLKPGNSVLHPRGHYPLKMEIPHKHEYRTHFNCIIHIYLVTMYNSTVTESDQIQRAFSLLCYAMNPSVLKENIL